MALIDFLSGNNLNGDSTGSLFARLKSAANTFIAKFNRQQVATTDEAIPVAIKNDDISVFMRGDRKGNLIAGNYLPEIIENFEGATVNVQKWIPTNTNFVSAQSTIGGYVFNNTNLTTASSSAILQSQRFVYKYPRIPIQFKQRARVSIGTNSVFDMGWGQPVGTTLIVSNGCSVRCVGGLWSAAISYNGVQTAVGNIVGIDGVTQLATSPTDPDFYVIDMIIDDDNLVVTVQDTQSGIMVGKASIPVPLTAIKAWGATALPLYTRLFTNGIAVPAPQVVVSELQELITDINTSMDASQVAGNLGLTILRNPFTGAPNTTRVNSTVPATATLSNTVASYTQPDIGYLFAAVAGAETDYLIIAYQVPAGSKFLCEGIVIDSTVLVAAVATTPTLMEWAIGFNSSAASLATASSVRKQLGQQSFIVGAAAGTKAERLSVDFITPEVTESGRFVQVALRMPVATATATQTYRGIISLKGRFI